MSALPKQPLPPPPADSLLDEIRAIKQDISVRFEHDVDKLCQHLMHAQEANRDRLVAGQPTPQVKQ